MVTTNILPLEGARVHHGLELTSYMNELICGMLKFESIFTDI